MLTTTLPSLPTPATVAAREVLLVTNADLREPVNVKCWPVQQLFEDKLTQVLAQRFGVTLTRAHAVHAERGHGFISTQREGSDVFAALDPDAPVIVLLTAWQYSHHIAPSLAQHRGPILLLANFEGTWPGLVGMLCLAGTLTSLNRAYARLWSSNFDDEFFFQGLQSWLADGTIARDTGYLHAVTPAHVVMQSRAGRLGVGVGQHILRHKEIIGLFDTFCMGMINGVFPQKALVDIGMPMEGLSQSDLLAEMALVPQALREQCLDWYLQQGMRFDFGSDDCADTALTRAQVLEQCAMLIALGRFVERFGLSAVGVQYQQGLARNCAASDFAEGAIGNALRSPIPTSDGRVVRPGKAIPCVNEVDMGTAIPQTMLFRLLDALGLPAETTLHDIRWGSEFEGTFYWDLEISGAVPFAHLKGGIAGATGYRQSPMYFPKGGATITGQGKAGRLLWARAHYDGTAVVLHVGTGHAVELPAAEFERRRQATSWEWPLLNCTLDGVARDQLMAGHESNHISIAYVEEAHLHEVLQAFVAQAITQGLRVYVAGDAYAAL